MTLTKIAQGPLLRGDCRDLEERPPAGAAAAVRGLRRAVPHALHVRIAFASEEMAAPICPGHILVHGELHVPPERPVLLRGHAEPGAEPGPPGVSKGQRASSRPPPDSGRELGTLPLSADLGVRGRPRGTPQHELGLTGGELTTAPGPTRPRRTSVALLSVGP